MIIKRIALFTFLIFLLLFDVLQNWNIIKERPLNGSFIQAPKAFFSWKSWFNGKYQQREETYLNDNIGLRKTLVRLNNEINYDLFKITSAQDVVLGKKGYMYEKKHIEQYYGYDYIGEELIKTRMEKLRVVTDTLARRGVKLVFIAAPSKADFFPEYIPDTFKMQPWGNNYSEVKRQLAIQHLSYIDFNQWFLDMKPTSKYPLYPQTGTHWSVYGMHLVLDSLVRYIEKSSGRTLAHFDYHNVILADSLRGPDNDIEISLNLLTAPEHYKMAYPVVKFDHKPDEWHPRVLTIGDSYWVGIFYINLPKEIFKNHRFWYYMRENNIYNAVTTDVSDVDLKAEVENSDYLFIVATVQNSKNIGWGFIEMMYDIYTRGEDYYAQFNRDKKDIFNRASKRGQILGDIASIHQVRRKASDMHITVDSAINAEVDIILSH